MISTSNNRTEGTAMSPQHRLQCTCSSFINPLPACAKGYSSLLCSCLVQFSHAVTESNWPRRHLNRLSSAKYSIENVFFLHKHPLCKATEFALKLLAQLSAICLALLAHKHTYLNHTFVFAQHNTAHACIFTRTLARNY